MFAGLDNTISLTGMQGIKHKGVAKRGSKIGNMKCPRCQKTTHQHKIGKTRAGSQKYRCYFCKKSYTPTKKHQGYDTQFRQKAIQLYIDGMGLRRIARHMGVHHQSVANWVKEQAEILPRAPVPEEVKTAEFDELFTFIGDKKTESTLSLW